jgi:NAD(P)-dependent dehydrogenase (short-subunit alcohol dehydrogenase family)
MPNALITGANRGIGLEFVRQYAHDGWTVIACCRSPSRATELLSFSRDHEAISVESLDVADTRSVSALAQKLRATPIDLLINNAGIYSGADRARFAGSGDISQSFGTIDYDAWEQVLRVNTIAPIRIIEAFAPLLAKQHGAKIINITSRMGSLEEMGNGSIAYRTSKAALNAAMRVIAHDLQAQKISIVNLHPGWVQTDMGGKNAHLKTEESVRSLRKTIAGIDLKTSSQFLNYDGTIIPW